MHQPVFVPAIVLGAVLIVACVVLLKYRVAFTRARDRIQRETYGFGIKDIKAAENLVVLVCVLGFGLGGWIIFAGIARP